MTNWETVVGFITLFGFILTIMRLNESINTLNATNLREESQKPCLSMRAARSFLCVMCYNVIE